MGAHDNPYWFYENQTRVRRLKLFLIDSSLDCRRWSIFILREEYSEPPGSPFCEGMVVREPFRARGPSLERCQGFGIITLLRLFPFQFRPFSPDGWDFQKEP